ncbi:helix-turn-helix domain-containing protein [Dyadobacter sp. CY312]|uniref:helix-turn-helix domain-containing protein n=1 Tax=Dyadobacter sp. CY312 TaxID=2907303 RepID=UPI001F486FC1|nr:helix-turn-helix transcriptional regulator [Dyadobacter sp. CY312]MCE7039165.1 helix-turn-helix transcriptional regulator [Dyadobacter sp. CY312]
MDKETEKQKVGEFLKAQRLAAGFSQNKLASRIGVNQAYYSKIENGKMCPESIVLFRIAEALGSELIFTKK